MKKIYVLAILIVSIFTFTACSSELKLSKNMSEIRLNLFDGTNSNYYVSLACGYREQPYLCDGKHNDTVEFGIIELELFDDLFSGDKLNFELCTENETITGELEKNPFTNSFMGDIEKIIFGNEQISFKVDYGGNEQISLSCHSNQWEIDYKKAENIAVKAMSKKFDELKLKFDGECYLKIINNRTSSKQNFFWYFSVKNADLKSYSLIIDVHSGQIVVFTI